MYACKGLYSSVGLLRRGKCLSLQLPYGFYTCHMDSMTYHICLIRCRGYYLFQQRLGFQANLPASWSAAALLQSGTYTAPRIHFRLPMTSHVCHPPCLIKCQTILYLLCIFSAWPIESWGLFTCAHATRILAAAHIFESGDYFIQHVWRCSNNSRVVISSKLWKQSSKERGRLC